MHSRELRGSRVLLIAQGTNVIAVVFVVLGTDKTKVFETLVARFPIATDKVALLFVLHDTLLPEIILPDSISQRKAPLYYGVSLLSRGESFRASRLCPTIIQMLTI
jgi:hypothetical protein